MEGGQLDIYSIDPPAGPLCQSRVCCQVLNVLLRYPRSTADMFTNSR